MSCFTFWVCLENVDHDILSRHVYTENQGSYYNVKPLSQGFIIHTPFLKLVLAILCHHIIQDATTDIAVTAEAHDTNINLHDSVPHTKLLTAHVALARTNCKPKPNARLHWASQDHTLIL